MKKKIPIGYGDIKELIDKEFYYVDKTLMIKELTDNEGKISLFTRPRLFGKTLNLCMIRRFFEDERNMQGAPVDNGYIFDNLKIAGCGEEDMSKQGKYPVIKLSLKSAKQPDFEMALEALVNEISNEYGRHLYVSDGGKLSEKLYYGREGYSRIDKYGVCFYRKECMVKKGMDKTIPTNDERHIL